MLNSQGEEPSPCPLPAYRERVIHKGDVMKCIIIAGVLALCGIFVRAAEVAPTTRPAMADCKLSGPYTHGNLTVFLIHGPDRMKGREFLTLSEAMEKKLVVVHETSNVNELAIENTGSTDVYVQSGDIV